MSPEDLVKALAVLPKREIPELLVGPATLDDAGIVRLSDDVALVQTVDFFPPIVDDPVFYGRIAAANALSDVYAMGGKVHSCLSIVGWPDGLEPELLGQIMKGGQEKIDEAGGVLAGGHTVTDSEIKYGLAVTGTIDPGRIMTNGKARPGDLLVLTKRLGMGAISTGIKKRRVPDDIAHGAMEQMATLNKGAAEAALASEVQCMTDITGFGLLGHAREIAEASGVTVEIDSGKVPAFASALDLIAKGVLSGGAKRTRAFLGDRLRIEPDVAEPLQELCLDAETSGGLLIAVAEERVDALLADLESKGAPCAAIIGRIVARDRAPLVLRR